jgi:hypothetical protein
MAGQWLGASRKTRQAALRSCLDRIRSMDPRFSVQLPSNSRAK